jgi:hypothetical protein
MEAEIHCRIVIKSFCLSNHHCIHLVRWSNPHNQIYSSRIGNDNIIQRWHQLITQCQLIGEKIKGKVTWHEFVNAKYETSSLLWWRQKDPKWHCGMQPNPPWEQWRKWVFIGSKVWPHVHLVNLIVKEWGKFNLVHNTKEEIFEA